MAQILPSSAPARAGLLERLPPLALASLYALLAMLLAALPHWLSGADYVGADNDDVMRLIEVRDLLSGQGWFDMTQMRLGPAGGTLMHWSRFIDLPIASLILVFRTVLPPLAAEAAALAVWPLLLILPVFWGLAIGARHLAGKEGLSVALMLGLFFIAGTSRFDPGAIDHHNAQIALVSLMVAMLLDPAHRRRSAFVAGLCVALAMAIGAETAPLMAMTCACVALRWAWHGAGRAGSTIAFGLTLAGGLLFAFMTTIPPARYGVAACDSLSIAFVALGVAGGLMLAICAWSLSGYGRGLRFAGLGVCAILVLLLAREVAPQCLGDPLANLDPLLRRLWLDYVLEAQSLPALWRHAPELVPGAYAVGIVGAIACVVALVQGHRREAHLILLALILLSLGVAVIQVRGGIFACFIALFPLADACTRLRLASEHHPDADFRNGSPAARPRNVLRTAAFIGLTAMSVPFLWALAALAFIGQPSPLSTSLRGTDGQARKACTTPAALAPLQREPVGLVAAPVDMGTAILRYTDQHILSAPYHRNQAGMLAELRIGLAPIDEALALIRKAGVTLVVVCPGEGSAEMLAKESPDGLAAKLLAGEVPPYLERVESVTESPLRLYRVRPQ
ncbi:hypothetical protein [Xaviernesmea oryzae]|uniref:hypothetical protein n=1 Tax=Xaviernesmea oryzae TaxID=464029 RepID=UPI0008BC30A1|nr:hypothetical protein [Xaviernesmea oryzae]SEL62042.1 hypothetical protein SAMN04487976_110124 [Xaviernesmea oryzae]